MKSINKDISIIGMTLDMGAGSLGSRLGPEALRIAGLVQRLEDLGYGIKDLGDLEVENGYSLTRSKDKMNHYDLVLDANDKLYRTIDEELDSNRFPLILGGDHSLVLASGKAGLAKYDNLGIIYFDAHGDINTSQSSPSGNIHGMPIAMLMGYGDDKFINLGNKKRLDHNNIVYIGLSDLDDGEIDFIKENNIRAYTVNDIEKLGIGRVMEESLSYIGSRADHIHVSFDIDVMDPAYAPGTGINIDGGLTYREARLAMTMLSSLDNIVSLDFVEVNPLRDYKNKTADLGVDLLSSFFGERLL